MENQMSQFDTFFFYGTNTSVCKITKVQSYSYFGIWYLQIWTYHPTSSPSQKADSLQAQGNIVPCTEQQWGVNPTPAPMQDLQRDAVLVSQGGRHCGNSVAQLLCCLKTSLRNQNDLLSVLMVSQNHPVQIQLSFWAATKPVESLGYSTSSPSDPGTSFYQKNSCPERFTWLRPFLLFLMLGWTSHIGKIWTITKIFGPLKRDLQMKRLRKKSKHCYCLLLTCYPGAGIKQEAIGRNNINILSIFFLTVGILPLIQNSSRPATS